MNLKNFTGLVILITLFTVGCAGNYGNFKRQTRNESKVTKQELIDNWSDYDIWLHYHPSYKPPRINVIIFDTKNDDVKILAAGNLSKVNDQEMWTKIVKENTASDGEFTLAWDNWVPITLQEYKRYMVPTTNLMDLLSIRNLRCHWEE